MEHVIRARFNDEVVRVYQAYGPEIALPALERGHFGPPFKMSRMTWIKPSFNWMMHRSGHASKPGQSFVLAIDITRQGFEWALAHGVATRFIPSVYESQEAWKEALLEKPVRIQWDPERDAKGNIIRGISTIQIGLTNEAVERYVNAWIVKITDVTDAARSVKHNVYSAEQHWTDEMPYPLPSELKHVCIV